MIRFDLKQIDHVRLNIFDLKGRHIASLGDEIMLSNQNIKPRILLESSFNWINSTPFSSIS